MLNVACLIHGISPIPKEVINPSDEDMIRATAATCFQKCCKRLKRMVALVSTAITPSYSVERGSAPNTSFPSHLPCPSIGCKIIVHFRQPKKFHHLSITRP